MARLIVGSVILLLLTNFILFAIFSIYLFIIMQILVQYSLVMNLGGLRMTVEIGNIVEFYDGRVEKINDNSVIVDLTIMDNFNELDL